MVDEKCFGSYIHGILDNPSVIDLILSPYLKHNESENLDPISFRNQQYDLLADWLRKYIDMDKIYNIIRKND